MFRRRSPAPSAQPKPQSGSAGSGRRLIADAHLPYPVVVAAGWSLCLLLIVAAAALIVLGLQAVSLVVVPLAVALLLAALLLPLAQFLQRKARLPRGLASLIALLVLIGFVVGAIALVSTQVAAEWSSMRDSVTRGLDQVQGWLRTGPLQLTGDQLSQAMVETRSWVQANGGALGQGALAAGATVGHFLTGSLIALIATFFFVAEGDRIWRFFIQMVPAAARQGVHEAGRRGWRSLGSYARTQVLVAGVDAVGIGAGALILGLPFVVPLTVMVFIASFVPILGAVVSGAVAVLIALVTQSAGSALIMLLVVLAVQQLESHVLQPFLMGRAVSLHPLAVIVAVAVGSFLMGVVGALFAVPVLAFVNSAGHYLAGKDPFPAMAPEAATDAD